MRTFCQHNRFTHFPKDPNCPTCAQSKPRHVYRKKTHGVNDPDSLPKPLEFGDPIVSNHKILKKSTPDMKYDRCAQIVRDAATEWFQACPSPSHSTDTVVEHLFRFHSPKVLPKHVY